MYNQDLNQSQATITRDVAHDVMNAVSAFSWLRLGKHGHVIYRFSEAVKSRKISVETFG